MARLIGSQVTGDNDNGADYGEPIDGRRRNREWLLWILVVLMLLLMGLAAYEALKP